MEKTKRKYRMIWITLSVILLIAIGAILFLNQRSFGRLPRGERLARIERSPNYRDGAFHNLHPTPAMTSDKGAAGAMMDMLFKKNPRRTPQNPLPAVKTNLHKFNPNDDVLVWFGHSSYFIQADGKRFLIDPVLTDRFPMSLMFSPFKGTDIYSPDDIPAIDYLVITHDHWDHLDYNTVMALEGRTGKIICPLGVGEHFERWGFDKDRLIEMDWNETASLPDSVTIDCLPARHFSGRGLKRNQSLWASYMLRTPSQTLYLGGDTGYDDHFADIARRFPRIDLAILENGQYNRDWRYIHTMPDQQAKAVGDLHPTRVLSVHHSKFSLSRHDWDEPLKNISAAAQKGNFNLLTPMIGEPIRLKDTTQTFTRWWENRE